jgi:NAD(P)-dependent dehydrogenase (short-subunit alcohol dehydrogenase family)
MFLSNNRDVAYRKGDRWLPRVDLSPRMPIYVDRETIPMPKGAAEGAVVVTGGVGGIGLVAALALAEAGALKIVLTSRTGETPSSSKDKIKEIESLGTNVSVEKCDTGKVAEVAKLLENVRSSQGKISVVIHSAGVTDDQPVSSMKAESMQKVCDPKAEGAWLLHSHTLEDDLFAFVTFSSVAALHGSSLQANYATANSYLDELARFRAEEGYPSVSVQWPAVDLSGKHPGAEGPEGSTVGVGTVKQVVKQLVCGREFMEPVQAVLPAAYLNPSTPIASSLLAPLTARKPSEVVATA